LVSEIVVPWKSSVFTTRCGPCGRSLVDCHHPGCGVRRVPPPIHQILLGEDGFYDDVFSSLRIPYEPIRWVQDIPEGRSTRPARVIELIDAFRNRGHLMADTDPLNYRQRRHDDLDVLSHGLTLWDLEREFAVGGSPDASG